MKSKRVFFTTLNQALDNIEEYPSYFMGSSLCIDLEKLAGKNVVIPSHGNLCWTYGNEKEISNFRFNLDNKQRDKLFAIQTRYEKINRVRSYATQPNRDN